MSEPQPALSASDDGDSKICGVDRALIERFLVLIRDNYPKADSASFFLEEVSGVTYTLSTHNLRDVLSHLATALSPSTNPEDLEAQISSAEEHFRRAIQEPYAIALGKLREKFNEVDASYAKLYHKIEKLKKKGFFADAPTLEEVQSKQRRIAELASRGRSAKRLNKINAEWDAGVTDYIEAYNQLDILTTTLSRHVHEEKSLKDGSSGKAWGIAGLSPVASHLR
jgi:hypothetical protein